MTARKKRNLKVKRTFEPGRLALTNLKEAYECLVPITVRILPIIIERPQSNEMNQAQMEETSV